MKKLWRIVTFCLSEDRWPLIIFLSGVVAIYWLGTKGYIHTTTTLIALCFMAYGIWYKSSKKIMKNEEDLK